MQLRRFDKTGVEGLVRRDTVLTLEECFARFCESDEGIYLLVAACPDGFLFNETLGEERLNILFHQPLVLAISERNQLLITNDAKATDVIHGSNLIIADGIDLSAYSHRPKGA